MIVFMIQLLCNCPFLLPHSFISRIIIKRYYLINYIYFKTIALEIPSSSLKDGKVNDTFLLLYISTFTIIHFQKVKINI